MKKKVAYLVAKEMRMDMIVDYIRLQLQSAGVVIEDVDWQGGWILTRGVEIRFIHETAAPYFKDGTRFDQVFVQRGYSAEDSVMWAELRRRCPATPFRDYIVKYVKHWDSTVITGNPAVDRSLMNSAFGNCGEYTFQFDYDDFVKFAKDEFGVKVKAKLAEPYQAPKIKKVIFNEPATIIIWADDSKTVVKCHDEEYDPEKGMAMAIAKKALGNKGNYFNVIKKWVEQYEQDCEASISELWDKLVASGFLKLGDDI